MQLLKVSIIRFFLESSGFSDIGQFLPANQTARFIEGYLMIEVWGEADFLYVDMKVFYKLILPFLVDVVTDTQIPNQFAEFFKGQYLIKDLMDCHNFYMCTNLHQNC